MISRDDLNPAQPRDFPASWSTDANAARPISANSRLALVIQPLTSVLAAAFLAVAGWKELSESPQVVLQRIAIASAIFFFVLRLTISHFKRPRRHAHATATVAILGAVTYPITAILLTNSPWPTNYIAFALAVAGCLYTSRAWFFAAAALVLSGWACAAFPFLQGAGGIEIGAVALMSLVCSIALLEIRLRKLAKYEKETAAPAKVSPTPSQDYGIVTVSAAAAARSRQPPWCPVCKSSRDAIIRHNGDFIVDANSAATSLLGMSVTELANLPVVGIFSDDRRDTLAPIFRFGNFEPLETIASGFKNEAIPVEILNGGLTLDQSGLKALLIRDLRKQEEAKRNALAISRRAQQSACRIRDLAALANETTHESLEAYLGALAKTVHRWLPCTIGCFVILWDNQAQGFSVLASSASSPLQPRDISLGEALDPIVAGIADKIESLVIDRVGEDEFRIRKLYPHEPVNAFCALPLKNAAGLMGFLLVLERAHREFSTEDTDYLTLVAHCAATACNEELLHAQLETNSAYERQSTEQSPPAE